MEVFQSYLQGYWGIILFLICSLVYLVTQGKAKAKEIILSLMLRAEKEAVALLLKNGDEKFMFVCDYGYQLLPTYIKTFITYKMFSDLAKSLYDSAKEYLLDLRPTELQERKINDPG